MDTAMRHKGSLEGTAEELVERRGERSSQSPGAQNSPKMGQQQRKDSGGQKRHSIVSENWEDLIWEMKIYFMFSLCLGG